MSAPRGHTPTPAWGDLEQALGPTGPAPRFRAAALDNASEAVRRYFTAAIEEGTPLAVGARLRMRGSIKLGRWLSFRARQLLSPLHGTVWVARVGGVFSGSDHYVRGHGAMEWRFLGLVPIMRAHGDDVSRSAAGRVAGESVWVPTALMHADRAPAVAIDGSRVAIDVAIGAEQITVEHLLHDDGRLRSSQLERWGDPDRTGTSGLHPFGLEATDWRTFDGVTIPSAGRAGWHHGTERWDEGEFFRYEITDYALWTG